MPTMVLYQMLAMASQKGSVQDVVCSLEAILDVLETKGTLTTGQEENDSAASFTTEQQGQRVLDVLNGDTLISILENGGKSFKATNQYGELMKCVSLLFFVPAVDNISEHRHLIKMFRSFIGDSSPFRCAIVRGCSNAVEIYLSLLIVSKIILLSDVASRKKSIFRTTNAKAMTFGDWLKKVKFFKSNTSSNNKKGGGSNSNNKMEKESNKLDIYKGWIFDAANDETVEKVLSSNKYTLLDLATIICNSPFGRLLLTRQNTFLASDYSVNLTPLSASESSSDSIFPDMIGYDKCFSPTTATSALVTMIPSKKPIVTDVDEKRSNSARRVDDSSSTNTSSAEKKEDCHTTDVTSEPTVVSHLAFSKKSAAINKNRKRSKCKKTNRVASSPSVSPSNGTQKSTDSSSSYSDHDDAAAEANAHPCSPSSLQKSVKITNSRKKSTGKKGTGKAALSTPSVSSMDNTINSTDCSSFEDDDDDDAGDQVVVGIANISSLAAAAPVAATTTNVGSSDSIGTADPAVASTTSSVLVEVEDDDDIDFDDDFHIVAHEEYFVEKSSLPRTAMEKDSSWEIIA